MSSSQTRNIKSLHLLAQIYNENDGIVRWLARSFVGMTLEHTGATPRTWAYV